MFAFGAASKKPGCIGWRAPVSGLWHDTQSMPGCGLLVNSENGFFAYSQPCYAKIALMLEVLQERQAPGVVELIRFDSSKSLHAYTWLLSSA